MKRPLILTALCALSCAGSVAQINSPEAKGYLERGILMCDDRNYEGCIDQMSRLYNLTTTAEQRELAHYYMCKATLGLGDEEALTKLRQYLVDYPVSIRRADVMMMVGDYHFNHGQYAEALAEYSIVDPMALTSERQDELNYRQGYSYMLLGESDMAASFFRTLQSKSAWRNAAHFYLGYIAYSKQDYPLALQYFRGLDTTKEPANAAPYYEAQIYYAQGEYDKCLSISRNLLASGNVPQFIPECNRLAGESLYNLGRTSESIPYLWKYCAEAKEPAPSAFYILGVSEYEKGDYDAAVKLFQQAIGSHSAMEQSAWLYLGQSYLKRGDKNQALMAFENAYKVDYDREVRETAFYNYAVARMDGGRVPFGNSVGLLQSFLVAYPDSPYSADVQRYIVTGYMSGNDYASALDVINMVTNPSEQLLKTKQRVLFVLGTREYSSGKVADAINHLTEARRLANLDPSIARQCNIWLGDCYYTRGNYDEAVHSYLSYINASPSSAVSDLALAHYDLGYTRFAQEKYSEAITDFQNAVKLLSTGRTSHPASLEADSYSRIADCRYYLGEYSAAADDYKKAYDLTPSSGDYALYQYAIMQGLLKDHSGKISTIDNLTSRFPSSGLIPQALLEKAESQSATGNTSAAIRTYNDLVIRYPSTAPGRNGYLQLAITYINSGERSKGIDTYKKVIRTFPSSEEARIAADDLKQIYAADGRLNELVNFLKSVPNAPSYEESELEQTAYQAAENTYINTGATDGLLGYIKEYPDGASRASALYYLADAAWNEGSVSQAQEYASQVLLNHPDSEVAEDALLIKAQAESELGKTEVAYNTFLELEKHASGSNMLRDARLGMMRTAMDLGKYAEAMNTAEKLLSSTATNSPTDVAEVKFVRGMANEHMGNHDAAYEDWEALAANPADIFGAKSAYYHAQSLFDRGLISEAKSAADSLITADTPHRYWLARTFVLYSDILRKQGNDFEANEYLKSLRNNYPGPEVDIYQMIDTRLK